MKKLHIHSVDLCSSESLRICCRFLCTMLITSAFLHVFEQQISAGVNGFVLLELPLYKHFLQRVKVPQQINPTDNDIPMDKSTSATVVGIVRSYFY